MGSTSPCCWPGLGFSCRTTASSPTWTTCTTNTQVGLQQPNLFLPTPPKLRRAPHDLPTAGTSIVFDMSLTYILVALVAVILNNALVELLSLHTRISVGELGSPCPRALPAPLPTPPPAPIPRPTGYLFALGPLLFVSICDVWLELFTRRQAYAINLVAVGVVAFGCTGMPWSPGPLAGPKLPAGRFRLRQ